MLIHKLPQPALDVIDAYWNIKAAENVTIRCPYFRNPQSGRERWGLTVYSGKGSPQDIEEEMRIVEKLERKNFSEMREEEIRDIMKKRRLGVECSGFVARVLDGWTRKAYKKPVYSFIDFRSSGPPVRRASLPAVQAGMRRLLCKMRPYTHIDVATFADEANAREIKEIEGIMPGDIIRFNSEIDHAILVTGTERNAQEKIQRIQYAHSVLEENKEGVKSGIIEFTNPSARALSFQSWRETPDTGHTIIEKGEPRVYRLFFIENAKLW